MFSFLKSKPKLKELIPDNFVDIHSHLLPGIDDGAKNDCAIDDFVIEDGSVNSLQLWGLQYWGLL